MARLPDWSVRLRTSPDEKYTRIQSGVSARLSWYLTENVKVVAVVPVPGDTDGSVRFPLSGQVTAMTAAGNQVREATTSDVTANAPTNRLRKRCRLSNGRPELPLSTTIGAAVA